MTWKLIHFSEVHVWQRHGVFCVTSIPLKEKQKKVDDVTENTLTCDQCSHKQVCIFGLASKVYTCITVMLNQ